MRRTALRLAIVIGMVMTASVFPGLRPAAAEIAARPAHAFGDSFGLCTHFGWRNTPYEADFPKLQDAIEELRIRYVRQRPRPPISTERLRDLAAESGVRWQAVMDYMPEDGDFKARTLDLEVVPGLLKTALQSVGPDGLVAVEGPNEYDATNTGGANAAWGRIAHTFMGGVWNTVRTTSEIRGLPVVAPSVARNTEEMFAALGDLSAVSDRGNLHAYSGERPLGIAIDGFIRLAQTTNPGQPIVISEFGWNTASGKWQSHPMTDRVKAKYLARAMAAIFIRPVIERAFIYQLVDPRADPARAIPQMHFGLLRNDLSRTPAFYAVRNMMHLLCDDQADVKARPLRATLAAGQGAVRSFLVQKASGVFYLALWQEVPSYETPKPRNGFGGRELSVPPQTVTLTFDEPVARARTFLPSALDGDADAGLQAKTSEDTPRSLKIAVPDEVMLVEIVPDGVRLPDARAGCRSATGSG